MDGRACAGEPRTALEYVGTLHKVQKSDWKRPSYREGSLFFGRAHRQRGCRSGARRRGRRPPRLLRRVETVSGFGTSTRFVDAHVSCGSSEHSSVVQIGTDPAEILANGTRIAERRLRGQVVWDDDDFYAPARLKTQVHIPNTLPRRRAFFSPQFPPAARLSLPERRFALGSRSARCSLSRTTRVCAFLRCDASRGVPTW